MKNLPMTISTTHCKLKGFETRSFSYELVEMGGEKGTGFRLKETLYKFMNMKTLSLRNIKPIYSLI